MAIDKYVKRDDLHNALTEMTTGWAHVIGNIVTAFDIDEETGNRVLHTWRAAMEEAALRQIDIALGELVER